MDMVFPDKRPKTIAEMVGSPTAFGEAKKWAQSWADGKREKPLLVYGPTGTGKTTLAHVLAAEFGWDIFEFNASDIRDEKSASEMLPNAIGSNSLFGGLRLILIDDVDSLSGNSDRGGGAIIGKVIQEVKQPVILTALDLYDKKLQTIKTHCIPLELRRVHPSSIASVVRKMALAKGIALPPDAAEKISKSVGGDIRAALNDLHAGNFTSLRDREKNIFEVVRTILKSRKYSEARMAVFSAEVDSGMVKSWIAQNIAVEYEKPYDIAEAYQMLSRADVFDGRISRTQYYGYMRYSTDLMSAGVALAKTGEYHKYAMYGFPDYIRKMGSSKGSRTLRKEVLKKIGRYCHCSPAQAAGYLFLIEAAVMENRESVASLYGFDEDEMDFIAKKAGAAGVKKGRKKKIDTDLEGENEN